jgi:hypothetical protein
MLKRYRSESKGGEPGAAMNDVFYFTDRKVELKDHASACDWTPFELEDAEPRNRTS